MFVRCARTNYVLICPVFCEEGRTTDGRATVMTKSRQQICIIMHEKAVCALCGLCPGNVTGEGVQSASAPPCRI